MRLAITSNGPGELAGWVRPLAHALYAEDPELDLSLIFVPDDYASGREADVARTLFPRARVVEPRAYVSFALGRARADLPDRVDIVLYLGGDLMHASRVHARLGRDVSAYKFASPGLRRRLVRAFAVDARNVAAIERARVPAERVVRIGNLAIDGALGEAQGRFTFGAASARTPSGGVVIMPGTRRLRGRQPRPVLSAGGGALASSSSGTADRLRHRAVHDARPARTGRWRPAATLARGAGAGGSSRRRWAKRSSRSRSPGCDSRSFATRCARRAAPRAW